MRRYICRHNMQELYVEAKDIFEAKDTAAKLFAVPQSMVDVYQRDPRPASCTHRGPGFVPGYK